MLPRTSIPASASAARNAPRKYRAGSDTDTTRSTGAAPAGITPVMSITELPRSRVTLTVEGWPVLAVRSLRIQVQSVRDWRRRDGEWRALACARSDAEAHDVLVEDQSGVGSRVARWQVLPAPRVAEPLLTEARRIANEVAVDAAQALCAQLLRPRRGTSPMGPHRVRWSGRRRPPRRGRRAARAHHAIRVACTSVRNR